MLGISRTTLRRVLNFDLHKFPIEYRPSSQQFKTNTGYGRAFVDKIKYNKDVLPYFGPQMWDDANFCLHELQKQCLLGYLTQTPTEVSKRPLHSTEITAWCVMSSLCCLGPLFTEESGAPGWKMQRSENRSLGIFAVMWSVMKIWRFRWLVLFLQSFKLVIP